MSSWYDFFVANVLHTLSVWVASAGKHEISEEWYKFKLSCVRVLRILDVMVVSMTPPCPHPGAVGLRVERSNLWCSICQADM